MPSKVKILQPLIDKCCYSTVVFNIARGHPIERENYVSDLYAYWNYNQKVGSTKRTGNTTSPPSCSEAAYWQPDPSTYSLYYSDNSTVCIPQSHQGACASWYDVDYHRNPKSSKPRHYSFKSQPSHDAGRQTIIEDYEIPPDIPVRPSKIECGLPSKASCL